MQVKVSAAHGDSVAEDYLESLESLMPWRDADEEDLNHVDDVELEGHEPLFPGETIDPELLLPAPPPALHEMNFTEQFPEMCVHRGATERHMSLRATAQYWGSLETFGVSQEGERAVTRNSNWDTRSKVACEMVPEGSRVLDIGCGPLMQVWQIPSHTWLHLHTHSGLSNQPCC